MKKLIDVFALLLISTFCNFLNAQDSYLVKGSVLDSVQNRSLSGATVSIFRLGNQKAVANTATTDNKGEFTLALKDTGHYMVECSFTGYTKKSKVINVNGPETAAGIITLVPQSATLGGVTVNAQRKLIEQTDDKIIYNVESDPAARMQTTIDLLRKTPFVSVDGDDNVRVNGQSNFRVLLNGRETAMFAQNVKEALQGFPSATISKIEVITNPSAKYDAEGVGGIINIITKKKLEGYNGSISSWQTTINQHIFNGNFNAKFGKLGISVNYGTRSNINIPSETDVVTTPYVNSLFSSRKLVGNRRSNSFWNFGSSELTWTMDSLNTVSFFGNVSGGNSKQTFDMQTTTFLNNNTTIITDFDQSNRREYPTRTVGVDYFKKFAAKPEKEFNIRMNAEFGESNNFLESFDQGSGYQRFLKNEGLATNKQYTLQSDYLLPIKPGVRLEVGGRVAWRRAGSDFESRIGYGNEIPKLNPLNTDAFSFDQDVYSAYTSYNFKWKKLTIRAGLRVEHTEIDGAFRSSKAFAKSAYTNLLPNLQLSTKIKELALVASYNQRLQRPYISYLNPFVENNDSLNISFGNPRLDAQTIHTVTVQSRLQKGKTFMGLTFSGSFSDNMIVTLVSFNPSTGVRSSTFDNVGKDFLFNVVGNINTRINDKWTYYANLNFQYRTLRNRMMREQRNSGIGGNNSTGVSFAPNKKLSFSHYIGFEQTVVDLQSRTNIIPFCGTGANYQVLTNKLRVGLMAQNYFAKYYDYTSYISSPAFETVQTAHNLMGKMVLTVNWSFGKLKEKVSKRVGVNNDDILGGVQ